MRRFVLLLFVALPGALCFGQTTRTGPGADPFVNRLERVRKMFPPEVMTPPKQVIPAKTSRPYCFYRAPGQKTLSVKPCPEPRKLRLLLPEKTKPAR